MLPWISFVPVMDKVVVASGGQLVDVIAFDNCEAWQRLCADPNIFINNDRPSMKVMVVMFLYEYYGATRAQRLSGS